MRTKKKPRKYIDPDAFHLARRKAGLTVKQASIELDVNERTIRNYENGAVQIPYPSFRLMRLLAGYYLLGKSWEDWGFHQNKLWSPEGRSFEAHELRYIASYISIARQSIKTLKAKTEERLALSSSRHASSLVHQLDHPLVIVATVNDRPSNATALFGAEVGQKSTGEIEALHCLQKKVA
jgi:transcriptional regulator with XRE-family HTH domain